MTIEIKICFFHHHMKATIDSAMLNPGNGIIGSYQEFRKKCSHLSTHETIGEMLTAFTRHSDTKLATNKKNTAALMFTDMHFSSNPGDTGKSKISIDITNILTEQGISALDIAEELNIFLIEENGDSCNIHNMPTEIQNTLDKASKKHKGPALVQYITHEDSFLLTSPDGTVERFQYDSKSNSYQKSSIPTHPAPSIVH
ncbi:hypothetical protein ACP3V3_02510 [Vibrio sp. PNB22_3_1]